MGINLIKKIKEASAEKAKEQVVGKMHLYQEILKERQRVVKDPIQKKLLDVMIVLASKDATKATSPDHEGVKKARRLFTKIKEIVGGD